MVIKNEKTLFSQSMVFTGKVMMISGLAGLLYITFSYQFFFFDFLIRALPFFLLLFLGYVFVFAKDRFELDFEKKLFANFVWLFGTYWFSESKKLPDKILLVHTVKRKLKWKRYFAVAIPFTTNIITFEIYLVNIKGQPQKLTSLNEKEAKEFSAKIADLYGVEWRIKDLVK
ncbi:MAG: hypothetical protein U9R19_09705 [Bacteroidota bacterium]|nr:hypothetical protein [Bacteroidota bacterium]